MPLRFPGGAVVFPPHPPVELNDTLAAIEAVRHTPSIDGRRIAVIGGTHGGYVWRKWAEKLRAAGKEVETYMPENAPHGFYFRSSREARPEETKESTRRVVAFVRKHLTS